MKLERFEAPGLAHYSYIAGSNGCAMVVDPRRDVDGYLEYARANHLEINRIVETHIHADYASGARQLSEATGAELWLSGHDKDQEYRYGFPHRNLFDGDMFDVGDLRVNAIHTPGHTPEHLSFLLADMKRYGQSFALLSGDFVFVGSLGRPDLLGEEAKKSLAGALFDSAHRKIIGLPDYLEVYPCHGAGSLCGSGMSDRAQTTLGYERACNVFLLEQPKEDFVNRILSTVPPFPGYYRRMKRLNSDGPPILNGIPGGAALTAAEFRERIATGSVTVLDLRRPESFGGAHIPGAVNLGAWGNLPLWAGWILPYGRPIYLVGGEGVDLEQARRALIRVGHDDIRGYLRDGMQSWLEAGYGQATLPQTSTVELGRRLTGQIFVLDVRTKPEWEECHIAGATHIPAGDIEQRAAEVSTSLPVYVVCASGYRSSIAASILSNLGLTNVVNVNGGMTAWNAQRLPVVRGGEAAQLVA